MVWGMEANIDERNEAIRNQVNAEMPRLVGGFESDEQEQDWRDASDARFMELVNAAQ
jgi:hypothetical protein